MPLPKRFTPSEQEPALQQYWQEKAIYRFDPGQGKPVFSIDSPPATVSGHLHLGHVYSYSQADFIARYKRMQGYAVFYPMGFDDNGLPTERLVEKRLGVRAAEVGRTDFIQKCLQVSDEEEKEYHALWQRLGRSIDWRHTYRTIDERSRRLAQASFLDLYRQDLVYRREAPSLWCPECRTAIAQAELEDLQRETEFVTIPFTLPDGSLLPIATTRPELLAACVAVFVHPEDTRYQAFIGSQALTPFYRQAVPILADPTADPHKGTGAVMCCTFGDQTDVAWWYTHHLALIEAIDRQGRLTVVAGPLQGLTVVQARARMKTLLEENGLLLKRESLSQSVRVHERCDTPVETIVTRQWFIRVLENRQAFLDAGEQIHWHPEHMGARYRSWVENLNWDWCISRQRYFGVPFPLWYCKKCGRPTLASSDRLPVDPAQASPAENCSCGSSEFEPETDVMDTWATSSLSPQIVSGWQDDPGLFGQVFPFSMRPQAHEIIRTWAFYTIVKSAYHLGKLPWSHVFISGWGLAGEGMGKISKSRGGGPLPPMEMIQRTSADAVRYWAASTGPGKDSIINEEKIQAGSRLVTKLWNVARFGEPFIAAIDGQTNPGPFTPADQWIRARLDQVIQRCTHALDDYDYTGAKNEAEGFFWRDLADNYLEMAKQRLYDETATGHAGACHTLKGTLRATLKLLAPFLPYISEAIYQELFAVGEGQASIHLSAWPQADTLLDEAWREAAIPNGELLIEISTAIRRFKSERNLSLGTELDRVQLVPGEPDQSGLLQAAIPDLSSVSRARLIEISPSLDPALVQVAAGARVAIAIQVS